MARHRFLGTRGLSGSSRGRGGVRVGRGLRGGLVLHAVQNDAEGVDLSWQPAQQGQANVQADRAATSTFQEDGQWGQEDGPEDFANVHNSDCHLDGLAGL